MAATQTSPELASAGPANSSAELLISLCPLSSDALGATLNHLTEAFPDRNVVVMTPDPVPSGGPAISAGLRVVSYTPAVPVAGSWILSAADFLNLWKLVEEHRAGASLLLGAEAQSLRHESLRALAAASATADLVVPRYELGPRDGLVNSAILYPVTRALFGTRPRYPLAVDLAISAKLAERLATVAQRSTASGMNSAIVWPVAEAAAAGLLIAEVVGVQRTLPPPDASDLNALLAQVTGSLFGEIESKASFWQRARLAYSPRQAAGQVEDAYGGVSAAAEQGEVIHEIQPMVDSFRIAYSNLQEIWSLVLPPNSLLGLKKLSLLPGESFRMPDALWVRVVYDFVLAYRLRTINRGHLLGALTPLYLAWVASHLLLTSGAGAERMAPEKHVEALAAAFEADKPYLVSRWRWPDRFNP